MTLAHDDDGNVIGHFDGKFVHDSKGAKIYWVEEGEVFSLPPAVTSDSRAALKIAELIDGEAVDKNGSRLFTIVQ